MYHHLLWITLLVAAPAEPPALEITANTTLDPAKTYGRLVIKASNITIDGNGAKIVGMVGDAKTFKGVGIEAKGASNVVLKKLSVRGFETGLLLEDAKGWTIEDCDFSNNFDDPSFGWGQMSRRGGIVFVNVSDSIVRKCRGKNNWVGVMLDRSSKNRLIDNDFSHCSEACLELWQATNNKIENNKLDYGHRGAATEVHARDSCCVLIESGSNGNTFADNSCTHGGDGIFLRSLNGWVSTGNRFVGNNCSYAHNHGFECWCPNNHFIDNKANHCSYGFWMGGSDGTVLIRNEASYNGDPKGNHFSPHLPNAGHAGIVFMRGSSTHIVAFGNTCIGNNGAGIAVIGDEGSKGTKWKAHHWVIDKNTLNKNRWGLYVQYADWIDVGANTIQDNSVSNIHKDASVTHFTELPADPKAMSTPAVIVTGPKSVYAGQRVTFDASKSYDESGRALRFRWILSDGTVFDTAAVEHVFAKPGFYRVGVTATNGAMSGLKSWDVYVVADAKELGTEASAGRWDWVDPQSKVRFADDADFIMVGRSSLRADIDTYGGGRVVLRYSLSANEVSEAANKSHLEFWIHTENENIPSWQDANPLLTIEGPGGPCRLRPKGEVLHTVEHPESRDGWMLIRIPLAGDAKWSVEGTRPTKVEKVSLGFDSWGAKPMRIWLDGLRFD